MKQSFREWTGLQAECRARACGLPHYCDTPGIATEALYVSSDPLQCCDLIEMAVIARRVMRRSRGQLGMGHETQRADAITGRDVHHAFLGQILAAIVRHAR